MMITKKHLARRTFLRGLGTTLALPLLDSMVPAFADTKTSAAKPVVRLGFTYVPNGIIMDRWTPAADGTGRPHASAWAPAATRARARGRAAARA